MVKETDDNLTKARENKFIDVGDKGCDDITHEIQVSENIARVQGTVDNIVHKPEEDKLTNKSSELEDLKQGVHIEECFCWRHLVSFSLGIIPVVTLVTLWESS